SGPAAPAPAGPGRRTGWAQLPRDPPARSGPRGDATRLEGLVRPQLGGGTGRALAPTVLTACSSGHLPRWTTPLRRSAYLTIDRLRTFRRGDLSRTQGSAARRGRPPRRRGRRAGRR